MVTRSILKENLYETIVFVLAIIFFFASCISFSRIIVLAAIILFVLDFVVTTIRSETLGDFDDFDDTDVSSDAIHENKINWAMIFEKRKLPILGMIPFIYIVIGNLCNRVHCLWSKGNIHISWQFLIIMFVFVGSLSLFWIKKQLYINKLPDVKRTMIRIRRRVLVIMVSIVYVFSILSLNVVADFNVKEKTVTIIEDVSNPYAGFFLGHTVVDKNGYKEDVAIPYVGLQSEILIGREIIVKYGDGLFGIPYSGIYAGDKK